ncbi:MAG: putative multidrug export ATP-binding/permease protein [Haloplasmataceae bacterium]|jgi:ATP-binding cassette subfamily B protein|nr:putative multidrug export ATP-binding/permease protein [Haloplasmataceae bacterium]
MHYLKTIFKWIKKDIIYLIISILAIIFVNYSRTFVPLFYKHAVDTIFENKGSNLPGFIVDFINIGDTQLNKLFFLGLALIMIQLFRALFMFISGSCNALFSENIAYRMRVKLYNHIQNLSYSYHTHAETGDLIQRSTSDVDTVRRFVGSQLTEVFSVILLFTFVLLQMLRIHTTMTLVSLIVVPFIFTFAFIFFKKIQNVFTETDESEGKMSTALQENLTGIRVVKAFARENYEISKLNKLNRVYADNVQKIINGMSTYWASSDFICFLQIALTTIFGAYFAIKGEITTGDLIAFTSYVSTILWPVRQLGRIIVDFGKSSVSLKRIEEVLNEKDEYQEKNLLTPEIKGEITFDHTSFQFPDASVPTLKNVSFTINKGETVAILGKTGSGKSTLAHLLVRLYDYTDGSIKIDGVELKDIDKKWIRKNIGIILQEPFLYSKTIYENIGILNDDYIEEEIFKAAQIAAIHTDITKFEEGYQTLIGERGVTLSGGQRQRVAIARMLVKKIPILIFDDSLSAVDTETDLAIRNALRERSNELTKIIITHRMSTAMEADKIIVFDDGEIHEMGTHDELINNNKIYKKIWEIQSSIETDFQENFVSEVGE